MSNESRFLFSRRNILKSSAAMWAGGLLGKSAHAALGAPYYRGVNTNSGPSELRITDLRYAVIDTPGPVGPCSIFRIDTNQGVYGLGEMRGAADHLHVRMLKNCILGEDPLHADVVFGKLQQSGGIGGQAAVVVAFEMALWDIAGKVYNVPIYQMLGGKWRDTIRIYAGTQQSLGTPEFPDPGEHARRAKNRKEEMGLTWLEMDLGIDTLAGIPGTLTQPPALSHGPGLRTSKRIEGTHAFLATELTDKGIDRLCEYVATVRGAVGMEIPLSIGGLGHIGAKSCIRLGQAYEKYNLSWMEDVVPWYYTDMLKRVTEESPTPTITGADISREEDFEVLCANRAVSKIHPDLATAGGIRRTHRIGEMAFRYGVPMAMHFAGTPVSFMASVHCAAATRNFQALENQSLDVPGWQEMVEGIDKPMIDKGYIQVPEKPGLGITLNDDLPSDLPSRHDLPSRQMGLRPNLFCS